MKRVAQHLEGAEIASMGEFHTEHVEGDGVRRRCVTVRDEPELCLAIDKSTNEPCGCHAIHARPRPCHPEAALIGGRLRTLLSSLLRSTESSLVKLVQERHNTVAAGTAEEIALLDRCETLFELLDRAERHRALPRSCASL